jgi:MFS family permease
MKDNFCNDSTSSFGTLTNIEAIEIAIITNQTNSISSSSSSSSSAATNSSTEPSTSNTNISSISNSQNDINGDVQKQIIDISSELNKISMNRNSTESSDLEDTFAVNNTKAYFNQIKPENDIKTYEDFEVDYDKQVELIIEKAAKTIENNTTCFRSGFYQLISFIFISIAWSVGNGLYAYVNVFAGHSPNFTCDMTSVYNNKSYNNNNFTINIEEDQCSYNVTFNKTNEMIKYACQKWIYDTSDMKSTIITEYNFVCDNNHKFETIYSLEQIGYVIGTLIFSIIADRVGRKPVFLCVLAAMTFFGLIQFFVTNFYIYMMLGFIINVFASGIDSVSVPLVLEMVNTNRRTAFGMGMEYVWVIILTSLSLIAYLINTWRYLRLFIFLVLGVISISSYWLVQESVTWLISTNRLEKASKVIDWVARFNCLSGSKRFQKKKRNLDESFEKLKVFNEAKRIENLITTRKVDSEVKLSKSGKQCESEVVDAKSKKGVFMDIIRNPRYRLYVLIMSLNWFATALIYDGLQYLNSSVGTNIFVNWTLMNIVELPAQLVCHVCLSRIGRRLTTSIFLVLCGTTLISTSIISTSNIISVFIFCFTLNL